MRVVDGAAAAAAGLLTSLAYVTSAEHRHLGFPTDAPPAVDRHVHTDEDANGQADGLAYSTDSDWRRCFLTK